MSLTFVIDQNLLSIILKTFMLFRMLPVITMNPKNSNMLLKKRRGLAEVVVVLILVTFAVLLAVTACFFINGIARARMKSTGQENVRFYKVHAWVEPLDNGTDRSVVAFKLYNIGGKSISVELIDVRGLEVDWSTVYFHIVNKTSEKVLLYSDLNYFKWSSINGELVEIDGYNYTQSTGSIYVKSGDRIIVYIKMPEIIYKDNIGQPMTLAIGTANANYVTETVIDSAI